MVVVNFLASPWDPPYYSLFWSAQKVGGYFILMFTDRPMAICLEFQTHI